MAWFEMQFRGMLESNFIGHSTTTARIMGGCLYSKWNVLPANVIKQQFNEPSAVVLQEKELDILMDEFLDFWQ